MKHINKEQCIVDREIQDIHSNHVFLVLQNYQRGFHQRQAKMQHLAHRYDLALQSIEHICYVMISHTIIMLGLKASWCADKIIIIMFPCIMYILFPCITSKIYNQNQAHSFVDKHGSRKFPGRSTAGNCVQTNEMQLLVIVIIASTLPIRPSRQLVGIGDVWYLRLRYMYTPGICYVLFPWTSCLAPDDNKKPVHVGEFFYTPSRYKSLLCLWSCGAKSLAIVIHC
jgi:hypothetical protein